MNNYIDMNTWPRAHLFNDYKNWDFPYIVITADLDVTKLYDHVKKEGLSFYFSMIYLAKEAADEITNFRYRFDNEGVFLIDENIALATHLPKGSDIFHMVVCGSYPTLDEFARKNREKADAPPDTTVHTRSGKSTGIISFSAIPWVGYTSFIRTFRNLGKDCNPKMTFGKYRKENGRVQLPFSVQTHHGLMDGYHVGMLYENVQGMIDGETWL